MTDILTIPELLTIRLKAWNSVEERYRGDPTIGLIKSIDIQLTTMDSIPAEKVIERNGCRPETPFNDPSELIAAASVKLFKEKILGPCYGKEIVLELRKARVPLPDDDRRATAAVTAIYGKRPQIFRKYPGRTAKAVSKWHLHASGACGS